MQFFRRRSTQPIRHSLGRDQGPQPDPGHKLSGLTAIDTLALVIAYLPIIACNEVKPNFWNPSRLPASGPDVSAARCIRMIKWI